MLSEEHKRRIESMYNEYYGLALHPETKDDMKSFLLGKYIMLDELLRICGYHVLDGEIRELE